MEFSHGHFELAFGVEWLRIILAFARLVYLIVMSWKEKEKRRWLYGLSKNKGRAIRMSEMKKKSPWFLIITIALWLVIAGGAFTLWNNGLLFKSTDVVVDDSDDLISESSDIPDAGKAPAILHFFLDKNMITGFVTAGTMYPVKFEDKEYSFSVSVEDADNDLIETSVECNFGVIEAEEMQPDNKLTFLWLPGALEKEGLEAIEVSIIISALDAKGNSAKKVIPIALMSGKVYAGLEPAEFSTDGPILLHGTVSNNTNEPLDFYIDGFFFKRIPGNKVILHSIYYGRHLFSTNRTDGSHYSSYEFNTRADNWFFRVN